MGEDCFLEPTSRFFSIIQPLSTVISEMAVTIEAETHVGMSFGPGMFTDEEFEKVAHEVLQPDITNYEYFVESYGTKFYRKYNEVRILIEEELNSIISPTRYQIMQRLKSGWGP